MRATPLTRTGPDRIRRPAARRPPNRSRHSQSRWTDQRGTHKGYFESTEFGAPRAGNTTTPARYGWLGGKQRNSDDLGGLVLMGVRLYDTATGRFLSSDPVPGGSANDYDYCNQDPVNGRDLDGRMVTDMGGGFATNARQAKRATRYVVHYQYVHRPAPPPPPPVHHHWYSAVVRVAKAVHRHATFGFSGCALVCGSISYQHGHVSAAVGGIGIGEVGPAVGWNSARPDQQERTYGFACIGFKAAGCGYMGRRTHGHGRWYGGSVGTGLAFSYGEMHTFGDWQVGRHRPHFGW